MEFVLVGWPRDEPALQLSYECFAYAGKFVMTNTGKAIARDDDEVVAAASFNPDRTDERTWWIRYLTVHVDHRGEGIGPRLADYVAAHILNTEADVVRIAVNNPYAYEALHKAGFGYSGERTGIAELVLERPASDRSGAYQAGWIEFENRDGLSTEERNYVASKRIGGPPTTVDAP